jgi:tRNA A-37 threonylcarbamoyl transferase component Bud32/tetratricopeptide (TPR) repeat protein
MDDASRLADMLRAIAEGKGVQANTADATPADESTASLIEELKVLGRIAEVHGSGRREAETGSSDDEPLSSWGPLTILERVGRGSYGDVYRAFDTRLDREVALKLLRRRATADGPHIIEEGRLLARVRHPNAITVHGADCIDGRTGIWMEFIEGRTLDEELQARGPLPATEVAALGIDICRALDAVHKAGVVHRDIKAQNVMREATGRTVLMDFGSGFSETSGDPIGGTPLYLAPEVLAGGAATVRSDVYAVGVLLYHLVTGRFPVEGATLTDVRMRHRDSRRVALHAARRDVPRRLGAAIERAIAVDPSERYPSAMAFEAALVRATKRTLPKAAALAGGLAAIAILSFAAWKALRPTGIPFQARDWVLVTAFENQSGGAPDGAVEHVLERELSASAFVNVVPRERIADALSLLGKPRDIAIDGSTGREVAAHDSGIRALVAGRIQKAGSGATLSVQIVRPSDGAVLATFKDRASGEPELLSAIRRQSVAVREALGEPVTTAQRSALEAVRLPSLRAAGLYADAMRALVAGGPSAPATAARLLESAIESDPAFASAHVVLSRLSQADATKAATHLQRAYDLSATSPERERHFIVGRYRERVSRQPTKAAESFETLLRVYPDDYRGVTNLAEIYRQLQREEDGTILQERQADLRPLDIWANWNAFVALSATPGGDVRARPYYERATRILAQRPAIVPPVLVQSIKLQPVSQRWKDGDIAGAHDQLLRTERDGVSPSLSTACAHMAFGELAVAEKHIVQAFPPPDRGIHLAILAVVRGKASDARNALADAEQLPPQALGPAAVALLRLGLRADAERLRKRLSRTLATWSRPTTATQRYGWVQDAQIVDSVLDVAEGRVAEGASILQAALPKRRGGTPLVFFAWESLADAYRASGRTEDARRVLRDAANAPLSMNVPTVALVQRLQLQLARLEREAGNGIEADRIEDSLRRQLAFADADHPIAKALRQ